MLAAQIQNLPPTPPTPPAPTPGPINSGPQEHVSEEPAYAYADVDGSQRIGTLAEASAHALDEVFVPVTAQTAIVECSAPVVEITCSAPNVEILVTTQSVVVTVRGMLEELPVEGGEVDRGTPVTITAEFSDDPLRVYASFLRPQENRPVVDPGYDKPGSRIRRVQKGIYTYVIDTSGFKAGRVTWHVWGFDDASKFGWFTVRDAPAQLL